MFTDYINSRAEKTWITKAGYPAVVVVQPMGHRCGYVQIPKDHPEAGKDYDDIEVSVHGEITYSSKNTKGTVFGFDCAHWGDAPNLNLMEPEYRKVYDEFEMPQTGTVRSLEFCIEQCESMAEQFKQLA